MSFARALGFFFAGALFFVACKKPTLQDTALIPDDRLNVITTDTLTVNAYTVREDSISMNSTTLCALGYMDDSYFGVTNAGFYLPFSLKTNNPVFDDTTVYLDSVILYLRYFSTYGDWRYPQDISVNEMTEGIADTIEYFSNKTFDVNPVDVGRISSFNPNIKDSFEINGVNYPPLMRVKLDNSFGQKFIDSAGTASYADNASFRNFFKGIYISATKMNGGKGIVTFDPYILGGLSISKLTIYYHDVQDTSKSIDFPANPLVFVNHYEHTYRGSSVEAYINNPNINGGDSLIFIQGLAGLNTRLFVPYLSSLGSIFINKAELVLTQVNDIPENDVFDPLSKLTLLQSDETGKPSSSTPDQVAFLASIFGGDLKTETDSTGTHSRYKFNLSRYYQSQEDTANYGIFILPDKRYQTPGRIVLGGGNHSKYAVKLNLTYSKIE